MTDAPPTDPVGSTARYLGARVFAHVSDVEALVQRITRMSDSSEILGKSARQFATSEHTLHSSKMILHNIHTASFKLHRQSDAMQESLQGLQLIERSLESTRSLVQAAAGGADDQ